LACKFVLKGGNNEELDSWIGSDGLVFCGCARAGDADQQYARSAAINRISAAEE